MSLFSIKANKIPFYLCLFILILLFSTIAKKVNQYFVKENEFNEYELIRKYLLNDSCLYNNNKPNLWIHTSYQLNTRSWKSFNERSSYDLNQPYLHLTIKSIIIHCGDDFNICLIDDNSFKKLIPSFEYSFCGYPATEDKKEKYRRYGMMKLLSIYGGLIIPNSFLCFQNLKPMYDSGCQMNKPFVFEKNNDTLLKYKSKRLLYIPDLYFIGVPYKKRKELDGIITYTRQQCELVHHVSVEDTIHRYLLSLVDGDKITLLSGELIGIQTGDKKPILLDNLMENEPLDLSDINYGIYIPQNELLLRTKFQWVVSASCHDIIKSRIILAYYFKQALSIFDEDMEREEEDEYDGNINITMIKETATILLSPTSSM